MGIPTKRIEVIIEGGLNLRGTLGLSHSDPVGFGETRLRFAIDAPRDD